MENQKDNWFDLPWPTATAMEEGGVKKGGVGGVGIIRSLATVFVTVRFLIYCFGLIILNNKSIFC